MLQKLGIGLNISASVLSLTTWADAEDVKQLYRNEFAQIGLQQRNPNVQIPEVDEDGNPIPDANQLYTVCFADFQNYIRQIDEIILAIGEIDSGLIPENAARLWDLRETPIDERVLEDLSQEYQNAQASGEWPAVEHGEVMYADLSNRHCDYLPEFKQMRGFIGNR